MNNKIDFNAYDFDFAKNSLLPLYEKAYNFELQQKNTINSRLSFPITILTLFLGALTFLIRDLPKADGSICCSIFFTTFSLIIISLIFAIYCFVRSIFPHKYAYIKSIGSIDSIICSLKQYNDDGKHTEKRNIEKELVFFLLHQYKVSADENRNLNKIKSGYFRRVIILLFLSVIFLMVAIPAYFLKTYDLPQKIQKIEIVNLKKEAVMFDDDEKKKLEKDEIVWPVEPDRFEESDVKSDTIKTRKEDKDEE